MLASNLPEIIKEVREITCTNDKEHNYLIHSLILEIIVQLSNCLYHGDSILTAVAMYNIV